jgi:anthranilate/para-aminobenzoate synthase component I
MELFLRKTGRKIVTKPIKGTRKKGFSVEEDAILKAELISSQKERAENLMIVDLMRNDLGRVCNYGTVKVNNLFNIESYATLHQMVSEVEGYLKDEIRIGDIIKSTFPPGSVTGAPKRRAVELIDELEPHVRGPYCGAIGIFYPNGDFTLSVGIRIMLVKKCIGTFWVGGGIVWDSDPEKEFDETLVKARAIQKALGIVE